MLKRDKNKRLSSGSGFTLIELLVSVLIIGLISTIFMVNYHNTNKRSELKVATQKLASDIRLAQNYSLGSKTYDGVITPSGGWGVYFSLSSPSSYIIFADKNGDHLYNAGEVIETKTLPAGVTISALSPANPAAIVFFPPDPVTYINNDLNNKTAQIELIESINNSRAAVTVNFFGLIDVN